MLLHESAPVVGLWRLVGEGPRGSLIRFRWRPDGIEGAELEPRTPLSDKADATTWARVSPARGLTTAVHVEPAGGAATVTVYGEQGVRMHKCPSAAAAAAVALPHSQVGCCGTVVAPVVALVLHCRPAQRLHPPAWPGLEGRGASWPPATTRRPWACSTRPCPPAGQPIPPGHLTQGQL